MRPTASPGSLAGVERNLQWARATAIILAAGVVIRLGHLLANRSLYIDEARLALNVAARSFAGLLQPLDYEQTAPIPFLWAEKLMTLGLGVNEIALRVLPFIAGCAVLLLGWRLAARLLPASWVPLAAVTAALSPVLIHYSNEAKPYSIDAALGAALLMAALDVAAAPDDRKRLFRLGVGGLVAILFSTPAILVLAAIGLALLALPAIRRNRGQLASLIAAGISWLALFTALYSVFYHQVRSDAYMRVFWEANFLTPGTDNFLRNSWHLAREFTWGILFGGFTPAAKPMGLEIASGAAAMATLTLAIIGYRRLGRQWGLVTALLVAGPFIVAVGASALRIYPFSLRVCQFLVLPFLLLLGSGFAALGERVSMRGGRKLLITAAGIPMAPALVQAIVFPFAPYAWQEIRPLVAHYDEHGGGDPIYVFANSIPAWVFYTTDWSAPDRARLAWAAEVASATGPAFENAASRSLTEIGGRGNLIRNYRGRLELFGISSGMQWRSALGPTRLMPDDRWAAAETRRIHATNSLGVWLIFSHYRGPERIVLDSLEATGLRQVHALSERGARLFQYR